MSQSEWYVRREGRAWSKDEAWQRFELLPEKFEMINGQLALNEGEREALLAVLLELVGADRAVKLGSADVWREAIANLPK